jgi:hypothetical protein
MFFSSNWRHKNIASGENNRQYDSVITSYAYTFSQTTIIARKPTYVEAKTW